MVRDTVQSAPDPRASPNLPLEPITSSSKRMILSTGMVITPTPGTVKLQVPDMKSLPNT